MPGALREGQRVQEDGEHNRSQYLHREGLQAQVCFRGHILGVQGERDAHPDEIGKKRVSLPEYFMLLGSGDWALKTNQGFRSEQSPKSDLRIQFLMLSRFLACAETALQI